MRRQRRLWDDSLLIFWIIIIFGNSWTKQQPTTNNQRQQDASCFFSFPNFLDSRWVTFLIMLWFCFKSLSWFSLVIRCLQGVAPAIGANESLFSRNTIFCNSGNNEPETPPSTTRFCGNLIGQGGCADQNDKYYPSCYATLSSSECNQMAEGTTLAFGWIYRAEFDVCTLLFDSKISFKCPDGFTRDTDPAWTGTGPIDRTLDDSGLGLVCYACTAEWKWT